MRRDIAEMWPEMWPSCGRGVGCLARLPCALNASYEWRPSRARLSTAAAIRCLSFTALIHSTARRYVPVAIGFLLGGVLLQTTDALLTRMRVGMSSSLEEADRRASPAQLVTHDL